MSEERAIVCLVLLSSVLFAFVGFAIGDDLSHKHWQAECVKRDFAEYNQKTGEWQWKAESEK